MKKKVTTEIHVCERCDKERDYMPCCDCCQKDFCHKCATEALREYGHAVFFSGSQDGRYCHDCDKTLRENGDAAHAAYRRVEGLRQEHKSWYADFNERSKAAEKDLAKLIG